MNAYGIIFYDCFSLFALNYLILILTLYLLTQHLSLFKNAHMKRRAFTHEITNNLFEYHIN